MSESMVSILFLCWNSGEEILEGVRSALAQGWPEIEVIVLDNGSIDGSPERISEHFGAAVRLIRFEKNLGYTGGYNRGFRLARGRFLLAVNPDVRLAPDFVQRALGAFEDPRVGLVAGRLLREDGVLVDSTGQFLGRNRKTIDRGYGEARKSASGLPGTVLSACGAAALYRREMLEDVADGHAYFDQDYFAFHEDLELGWRAWRAGWKAVHVPRAEATHLRSSGRKAGRLGLTFERPPEVIAHIVKNRYLTMLRHDRFGAVLRDLPWILLWEFKSLAALLVFRPQVFRQLWATRAAFRKMWAKRRADRTRSGIWGPWRRSVPPRGIW